MFEKFIRGRNYFTRNKRRLKEKKPTLRRFARLNKRIQRRIVRSYFNFRRVIRKRRRNLSDSYFRRYIFPKRKSLYKRTIALNTNHPIDYQEEITLLSRLRKDLKRQEINRMLNSKMSFMSSYKPLSMRAFSFGCIYLTHRRRNTFITISKKFESLIAPTERVVFKTSCGLSEHKGPKRATFHARLHTAKTASTFLTEQEFTSVDIIFSSGIGRVFTRLIRALNEKQIYVRYLIVPKRKPHGSVRKKKQKRL